jgi:spore maturation protein CgeB
MSQKILVIGPFNPGALAESYARGFERLGMNVVRFDSERTISEAGRFAGNRVLRRALRSRLWNVANRETIEVAKRVQPDLIFAVKCTFLHPETVREIRKITGAPFVNYYPDNPYIGVHWMPRTPSTQRGDLIEVFRQYSAVFMWERSLLERLRQDRVTTEYLPFAVDPELFHPQVVSPPFVCSTCGTQHAVVFVGTYTRARYQEITSIRRHSVAIWGDSWPTQVKLGPQHRLHLPIYGDALSRIHASAEVSLNVLNAESLQGHNMRTFEVPASGGVMLARYTAAQDELFPENEAAAYYRSPDEIDAKLDLLLGDAALRARIRANATRLAATQTYEHRAAQVLRYVGLPVPAASLEPGIARPAP